MPAILQIYKTQEIIGRCCKLADFSPVLFLLPWWNLFVY